MRGLKGRPPKPIKDRFEKFISKTDYCWVWTGSFFRHGYGKFTWHNPKKTVQAHRASYLIYKGEILDGLLVCHSCDNPPCVNPDHLWLGTEKENSQDRNRKGRNANINGEAHPGAKLTEKEVFEIRLLINEGTTHKVIACIYNVSPGLISYINCRGWRHLT